MTEPRITLGMAWKILGKDAFDIVKEISIFPDRESRLASAKALLDDARRIAKGLMANNHPDKNPNNEMAPSRFREVQEALECIEYYTKDFEAKNEKIDKKVSIGRDGFIEVKK